MSIADVTRKTLHTVNRVEGNTRLLLERLQTSKEVGFFQELLNEADDAEI
jgi:hypothetical protein